GETTMPRPAHLSHRIGPARIAGVVTAFLAAAAFVVAWMFFAPTQAGGGTSYAIIVGSSMEPELHRGDLAVVRESSVYRPGDVVLYDSRELGAKVLHRIVRVDGGRFVLKGDNNDFIDAERPTEEQIVGSLWASAPAVGSVTAWLRQPLHSALLVGIVTLIALGGGLGAGAAVRRPTLRPRVAAPRRAASRGPGAVPDELRTLLIGVGAAAVACVGLAVVSFGRPLTGTEALEAAYTHQGRFEYEARVPRSAAYPDGLVETGEPVFLRLVSRLRVSFDYRLESGLPVDTSGRIALDARLSDGRGWERVLPLVAERGFSGGTTITGVLDLDRIERMLEEVRSLTGSGQTAFSVAVLPRVQVVGRVGADPVDSTFAPALSFDLGDLRLQPGTEGEGVGPFAPRESGSGTRIAPARVALGALSLSVASARKLSLVGIAGLLLLAGLALAARRGRQGGDEHERIRTRHGHLILPVASRSGDWGQVIELADVEALVRLAEHLGKLILHVTDGPDRSYVVEDGTTAYRYRVHAPEPVATMVWPAVTGDLRVRR
ncbi:MAG: signal peptidase I, partial [Gaiellaceae bacterium]